METLRTILHHLLSPLMFLSGIIIWLIIAQRRFNRRGIGGLQHFDNYYKGLLTLLLEWLCKWLALALMLSGFIGWLFK